MITIQQLTSFISVTGLFKNLTDTEITDFHSELELVKLPRNERIFQTGEIGDSVYFIYTGKVDVFLGEEQSVMLKQLGKGSYFGEIGLLVNMPRSATAKTTTSVTLLKLTRTGFMRLFDKTPSIMMELFHVSNLRLESTQRAQILNAYFHLDTSTLQHLEEKIGYQRLVIGDCLFQQGDEADSMYLIVQGRLRVYVQQDTGELKQIAELEQGQAVGEYALLTDEKHSASVYAARDTDLIRIGKNNFSSFLIEHPKIILPITKNIIKQQQGRNKLNKESKQINIAVVPIHKNISIQIFAAQLVETLSSHGKTLHINSEQFENNIGYKNAAQISSEHPLYTAISIWLNSQENQHQFIVYEAQSETTAWTHRCIRSADRILLVADATQTSEISEIERLIQQIHSNVDIALALIQPANIRYPTDTYKWLERRNVQAHYHVQLGNSLLFRRMVRRLTDNAIALVLSGGGVRGFVHVGVLRAIHEAGLEIDFIGSSSMGALLGALFVTGHDYDDIFKIAKKYKFPKGLMDYTYPYTALTKSKALTDWFRDTYDGIDVEDLWQPFFSVSTNLSQASEYVHAEGPLWKAVRASMAIPALFSPLCHHGEILVDGAIMNNLPIDVMRGFCANGYIIAINASPEKERDTDYDFDPSISGWKILWSKLNFFAKPIKIPSLSEVILRSMEVNSASKTKRLKQEADVFIQMPTERFGILDFEAFKDIIECGYEHSKPYIDALKQKVEPQ